MKGGHTIDKSLHITGEKVISMTNPIRDIRSVNSVINGIWTVMNCSGTYGKTIYTATFVMLMDYINIIGLSKAVTIFHYCP